MQLIDLLLCGISVLPSHQILYELGNNLNQTFPALKLHINKFNPTGTNTLQFPIRYFNFYTIFVQIKNFGTNANQYINFGPGCKSVNQL